VVVLAQVPTAVEAVGVGLVVGAVAFHQGEPEYVVRSDKGRRDLVPNTHVELVHEAGIREKGVRE
jgi:hypothetical protein